MARYNQFTAGEAPIVVLGLNDSGEPVTIPDAHFLFTDDFKHEGNDLVLTGEDGQVVIVEDYFSVESPPDLASPEGARVYADVVNSLATSGARTICTNRCGRRKAANRPGRDARGHSHCTAHRWHHS